MMRTIFAAALSAAFLCASAAHAGGVSVSGAWIRPTPPGAPTAAGYLTIANHGHTADRLVSVDSPAAVSVTVHSMSNTGGVMRMRPVIGGLEIAPGASIGLGPEGDHLMFEGLKHPLKAGDMAPAVLHFQHAGAVRIRFAVGSGPGGMAAMVMR